MTEEELSKAWRGRNHLVVCTSLQKGIVLVGTDLSGKYPLQPDYLRNVIFEILKEVHEASLFLEDNIRFEYACVVLVNSLKSLLFLEKLLDRKAESLTIAEGLSAVFGGVYGRVIQIYFNSAHRCRRDFGFGGNVMFSSRNDQRYSRMMYQELLTSCESIRTYAERMYRESSKNLLF